VKERFILCVGFKAGVIPVSAGRGLTDRPGGIEVLHEDSHILRDGLGCWLAMKSEGDGRRRVTFFPLHVYA
jgi:hypothetical protein